MWRYLICLFIGVIIGLSIGFTKKHTIIDNTDKVDSLNIIIDSLELSNTTIKNSIDSSKVVIQIIEKWYEKDYNTILTQPTDNDCMFFSNYISGYSK